ncbi:MAG: 2-oxoglutarate dehydrogenase complex dihydrolipoyllysine-residue succinyltransferase [Legionellales bacterium]|nr:2-oxoglutarate dehydrogenase complex dihydrolipoyllysine-residue succinyltransferase [Legionellales bacterium]
MSIEIKVPTLPESVADAVVSAWHKKPGDFVTRDENLVDIETDKVMLEVPAPQDGILKEIVQQAGSTVKAEQVLAIIEAATANTTPVKAAAVPAAANVETSSAPNDSLSPSVRRIVAEKEVNVSDISGTGKDGRITKTDVLTHLASATSPAPTTMISPGSRPEQRVAMTRLRARIAERLLSAQHNAAILTTFNEIDMSAVMNLRNQYQDNFEKQHGIRLGFMSFFTKAAIEALKRFPAVNASIDGNDMVYHGYFDIGMAVSTDRGLVVPVLRNADRMSMADIESSIAEYAKRARDGKLTIDEMTGGTFTITNGGVFGSLLATPIINPPQSGILGLHKIEKRPVVVNDEIVIRPMMYVALSYDHRIIDGRESVQFLKTVKEMIEDPTRLLLEV